MDKRLAARNLFIIILLLGFFLIVWAVISNPADPSQKKGFVTFLKENFGSSQPDAPRAASSTEAITVALAFLASGSNNAAPLQVVDVKMQAYHEAITRLGGANLEGVSGVTPVMLVWAVIFRNGEVGTLTAGSNLDPYSAECTYVLVDPQKDIAIQKGPVGCR